MKIGSYLELDQAELTQILRKLGDLQGKFSETEIRRALAQIVRPLATEAKKNAPVMNKKAREYDSTTTARAAYFHNQDTKRKKRKSAVPQSKPGQLKKSIGVFYPRKSLKNVVTRVYVGPAFGRNAWKKGADGWFGHFVEYGTTYNGSRRIQPQPFMLKAWNAKKADIANKIINEIDQRIATFRKHGIR